MKKLIALALCAAMVLVMSFNAFAASGWEHDANGWKWNNGDGTYYKGGWKWCDGNKDGKSECYYFSDLGYAVTNALTPDGYTVNADGAWIVDQIVQVLAVSGPSGSQSVATPSDAGIIKTVDQYVKDLKYQGVDGTETATIGIDGCNINFDVVSAKSSAELTPEKAKELYYGDDHYAYMQKMANAAMAYYGTSMNVIETVKTSDGVTVYKYTYYGVPL